MFGLIYSLSPRCSCVYHFADIRAADSANNALSSSKRKGSQAGIAIQPSADTSMPTGRSCHGFLEICLYGFDSPNKFMYALRRIPYVRIIPYQSENDNIPGEEAGTVATYLRLRDVICLLKIDVGSLYSLTTRCRIKMFSPSDYTEKLFATVYDPVGRSDPMIAKMTWRHASSKRDQEFLERMIVLDKFLHSILPVSMTVTNYDVSHRPRLLTNYFNRDFIVKPCISEPQKFPTSSTLKFSNPFSRSTKKS